MRFLYALLRPRRYDTKRVKFGKVLLKAFVADSFLKKMFGLMFWNSISSDSCMLFLLGKPVKEGIWMLNMNFPIDIVWLNKEKEVVSIVKNAKPCKFFNCQIYKPEKPANYVLELKSGATDRLGIKIRSKFDWQ